MSPAEALAVALALLSGIGIGWLTWGPRRAPGRAPEVPSPPPVTRAEVEALRSDLGALVADVAEVVTVVEALVPHAHLAEQEPVRCPAHYGTAQCTHPAGHPGRHRAPADNPWEGLTWQDAADLGAPAAPERAPDTPGPTLEEPTPVLLRVCCQTPISGPHRDGCPHGEVWA